MLGLKCSRVIGGGLKASSPQVLSSANGGGKLFTAKREQSTANRGNDIVLIDGVRTPFQVSNTGYQNMMGYQLQKHAVLLVN